MKTPPFPEFRDVVVGTATELAKQGYQLTGAEKVEAPAIVVRYCKFLDTNTKCEVSFQLLPYVEPFGFKVHLSRIPSAEDAISRYSPLGIGLRNLMIGLFEMNPFPPGVFYWEFTDKQSLRAQVTHAESLLLDYGVKWLEDPSSNLDWVKRKPS